ncbi:MAG: aminopeptidase [Chloroflexi bacterium]|nr:aminopeptidase [Chloroflexota bacterium]
MDFESMKLSRTAKNIVEKWAKVQPGENVCVVTDTNKLSIAEAIANASHAVGAETVICIMTPRGKHGEDPPKVVGAAMAAANVVFAPISYSIGHTEARHAAVRAGARFFMLREITEESFTSGAISADPDEIYAVNMRLIEDLKDTRRIRMTTELGSDISMSVEGRPPPDLVGRLKGGLTLPSGEVAFAPVEGTANGVVIFDHGSDGVGLFTEPAKVTVKDGQIVKIEGGESARKLQKAIEGVENATNIAEFAIGTNPLSRMTGVIAEDKILRGCVHIGIGTSIFIGGKVKAGLHFDLVALRPTVWCDDKEVVSKGVLNAKYL